MSNGSIPKFSNAPMFFQVAQDSISSIELGHETQALIPIIFSIMSLECFVNEIGLIARTSVGEDDQPKPDYLVKLGESMKDLEDNKVSLETKLCTAKCILTKVQFVKGKKPFQDLKLLCDLRNALIHFKGEKFRELVSSGYPKFTLDSPARKVIARLKSRKLLKFNEPSTQLPTDRPVGLIELVGTPEVAKWACNTVAEIVHSITDFPEDSNQTFLIKGYSCLYKKIT
ncbi:hypothetical protein [Candidatus Nitrospira salsa]